MKKLHIATSPLTGQIFVGHVLKDGYTWGAGKQEATGAACAAVADHVIAQGGSVVVTCNGKPKFEVIAYAANDLKNGAAPQSQARAALAATQSAVAVPASMPSLTGDAALAHEQCRAVVHLALAVAEVYSANAKIVANDPRLAEQIGSASAEVMEFLGDTLNATDATPEDDDWLDPVFCAAQARWPVVCESVQTDCFSKVRTQAQLSARQAAPDAALSAAPHPPEREPKCWCETCDTTANSGLRTRMSCCPLCGSKRCPKATHHDNACTIYQLNSNAQGQA